MCVDPDQRKTVVSNSEGEVSRKDKTSLPRCCLRAGSCTPGGRRVGAQDSACRLCLRGRWHVVAHYLLEMARGAGAQPLATGAGKDHLLARRGTRGPQLWQRL